MTSIKHFSFIDHLHGQSALAKAVATAKLDSRATVITVLALATLGCAT
jgi:hypothetical protein